MRVQLYVRQTKFLLLLFFHNLFQLNLLRFKIRTRPHWTERFGSNCRRSDFLYFMYGKEHMPNYHFQVVLNQ